MGFDSIILGESEQVATITINRPEKLNALNRQVVSELLTALDGLAKDSSIRVLVISGTGRAFSSGSDFSLTDVREGRVTAEKAEDLRHLSEERAIHGELLHMLPRLTLALQQLDKPTIAMVNGDAVGGGAALALACDMRVGSHNARFMWGFTRMGCTPPMGDQWLLPRVVGLSNALKLMLTADFCTAEEAYRIGLLNDLAAAEDLEKVTLELASKLKRIPPIGQRITKFQTYRALESDLQTIMAFSSVCNFMCGTTEDYKEAIRALAEKRPPVIRDR